MEYSYHDNTGVVLSNSFVIKVVCPGLILTTIAPTTYGPYPVAGSAVAPTSLVAANSYWNFGTTTCVETFEVIDAVSFTALPSTSFVTVGTNGEFFVDKDQWGSLAIKLRIHYDNKIFDTNIL
jgi:hypothetical protein